MTESELDVLWQRALHEAVAAGEPFTRYRFAALVRAQVIEQAARLLDRRDTGDCSREDMEARACAAAVRGMADSGHSAAADAGASTWQPMETAPKGERILMLMKHGAIEGQWDGETGSGYYWRQMEWYPTHWMPLPPAPKEA